MEFKTVACNICDSDKTRFLGKRIGPDNQIDVSIVECAECGFIYPDPTPFFTNEEEQSNFSDPSVYFPGEAEGRITKYDSILREIERYRPDKGIMLDVGCGRGEMLSAAGKRGWKATGTDVSKAFVEFAKERFKVNAIEGDIDNLDLKLNTYDCVTLISVIQYVRDPLRLLKKVHSLLKPGGILYIETTNDNALVFRAGDILKSIKHGRKVTTHLSPLFPSYQICGFSKRSMQYALKRAGYSIRSIRITGYTGGGAVKGGGAANRLLNILRKAVVFAGGMINQGHLLFCVAQKMR